MAFLTKDQIINAPDLNKFVTVEVPEWGGTVNIRKINGLQREKMEAAYASNAGKVSRAQLLSYCLCDENGVPLFNEADCAALDNKSAETTTRVFLACMKHNGFLKEDIETAEKKS